MKTLSAEEGLKVRQQIDALKSLTAHMRESKSVPMTEVLENGIRDAEEQLKTATGDLAVRFQGLLVDLKGRLAEAQKPGAVRVWQRIPLKTNPDQK